ncbi:hypothetical protein [Amycolatopsis methanolica]|uniref:Alpha/beta hydrolase n=1 Tax=Amycolatopsis methanolica 239 TaxID=1068978 RepID=A0A076MZ67_AMYME|nr:hypothetical protein [Amycolatopsis methanolica]AIJ22927.1 hypothetical protein AMETH_2835 [Amycolatopsis methanolica 239]
MATIDARGHGESGKPHDPAYYGEARMAQDVSTLLDVHAGPRRPRRSARPAVLARAIPGAAVRVVAGDHLSALRDPDFTAELIAFLKD